MKQVPREVLVLATILLFAMGVFIGMVVGAAVLVWVGGG